MYPNSICGFRKTIDETMDVLRRRKIKNMAQKVETASAAQMPRVPVSIRARKITGMKMTNQLARVLNNEPNEPRAALGTEGGPRKTFFSAIAITAGKPRSSKIGNEWESGNIENIRNDN